MQKEMPTILHFIFSVKPSIMEWTNEVTDSIRSCIINAFSNWDLPSDANVTEYHPVASDMICHSNHSPNKDAHNWKPLLSDDIFVSILVCKVAGQAFSSHEPVPTIPGHVGSHLSSIMHLKHNRPNPRSTCTYQHASPETLYSYSLLPPPHFEILYYTLYRNITSYLYHLCCHKPQSQAQSTSCMRLKCSDTNMQYTMFILTNTSVEDGTIKKALV